MSYPKKKDTSERNLKNTEAILYDFVAGGNGIPGSKELTADCFANQEEFIRWKDVSDSIYAEIRSGNRCYDDHVAASLRDEEICQAPSCEEVLIAAVERQEQKSLRRSVIGFLLSDLSEKQRRRFCLYFEKNLTEQEIAASEGVTQQVVSRSIIMARRKIERKKCELFVDTWCKMRKKSVLSESEYCEAFSNLENRIHRDKGTKPA